MADDGHLGAVARFTGDAVDFHGLVAYFHHFRFKEAAHQVRMAAGEDDFRSAGFRAHFHHVEAHAVADAVVFIRHAFAGGHDALEFAEVHKDVPLFKAADGARHQIAGAVLELVVKHFLFRIQQLLEHGLAGSLHRDAAKALRRDVGGQQVVQDGVPVQLDGQGEGDLVELVGVFFIRHHFQIRKDAHLPLVHVDFSPQVVDAAGAGNHLAVGGEKSGFQSEKNFFTGEPFFPLVVVN